ncbi:MAG: chorismate mutase [Halobacteriales archaeon]|nr:chorismate mutase [Halobacteriales archaeon]
MSDLEALRREMRELDQEILRLVAQRMRTAQRIGAAKRRQGLPVRNYEVEAQVIRATRAYCKRRGIDTEVGEDLMRTLIRAAVQVQEDGR